MLSYGQSFWDEKTCWVREQPTLSYVCVHGPVSVFPIVPERTQSLQVFAPSDPDRSSKVYYDTIKTKDTSDPDRFLWHWKLALCSCASTLAAPTADREAPRPRWETN